MVTVVECEEDLHEVVPDGVFWNCSVVSLGMLDDGAQVAAPTVLHEDVENTGVAVNMSVVITYDVFVVEVLEDVPALSVRRVAR